MSGHFVGASGREGTRLPDANLITSEVLYQLSYVGVGGPV